MLAKYIKELEKFIFTSFEITNLQVIRNSIRETDLEAILIFRFKITFFNDNSIEITERLIERNNNIIRTKYSYHYQDKTGNLIKRWDNAPHHSELKSFPHHIHISEKVVVEGKDIAALDVIKDIISDLT